MKRAGPIHETQSHFRPNKRAAFRLPISPENSHLFRAFLNGRVVHHPRVELSPSGYRSGDGSARTRRNVKARRNRRGRGEEAPAPLSLIAPPSEGISKKQAGGVCSIARPRRVCRCVHGARFTHQRPPKRGEPRARERRFECLSVITRGRVSLFDGERDRRRSAGGRHGGHVAVATSPSHSPTLNA